MASGGAATAAAPREEDDMMAGSAEPAGTGSHARDSGTQHRGGGFYIPPSPASAAAVAAAAGAAAPAFSLETAMERLRLQIPEDERDSSESQARAFFERVIPCINGRASAVRGLYTAEYGASASGTGCICLCGKCHLSYELPFAEMEAFLYTSADGEDPKVYLTSCSEHSKRLKHNGATSIPWVAFGKKLTLSDIDQQCPPKMSEEELANMRANASAPPQFLSTLPLPNKDQLSNIGLPPMNVLKTHITSNHRSQWSLNTLRNFVELPCKWRGNVFPPAYQWPRDSKRRNNLYNKFTGSDRHKTHNGDQTLKDAAKLYWIVHHADFPSISNPDDLLDERAIAHSFRAKLPSKPVWLALMRERVLERVGDDVYTTIYD